MDKPDKSPQGFYDEDIIPLLDKINSKEGYETTSSCSGRITLMQGVKKGESKWVFKTHEKSNWEDVFAIVSKLAEGEQLRFLYEPLIVHVKCANLSKAEELLSKLHCNGFKKSCLISFKSNLIEINDTGKIESIVSNELSAEYVKQLVGEANTRLEKTKGNIRKLSEIV